MNLYYFAAYMLVIAGVVGLILLAGAIDDLITLARQRRKGRRP